MSANGSRHSLRFSLTRRLALVLAVIGTAGAIAAYVLGDRYANLAYDRALFDDVATLAGQVDDVGGGLEVNLPPAALKWLLADEGEQVIYRVIDERDGRVIGSNGDLGVPARDAIATGEPHFRYAESGGKRFRVAYTRHVVDPHDLPVLVEIGETLGKRNQMTRAILAVTILLMATMIGVAVGMVWQGVGSSLSPLRELEEEAAQRSGANLTPLDPQLAPQEVRALIEAINRMMDRVSQAMDSQSRFIANAAHQLRTPVAGLRLQAQLALKSDSPQAVRASIVEVEASAARAAHVIEQLLTLSRAEGEGRHVADRPVDLAKVAQQVIERYLPAADRRRVDLGYDGLLESDNQRAVIAGNAVLIAELLGNLVDNAIRYGWEGGRVTIRLRHEQGELVAAVEDNGPGFPLGEREHVFQRFYRPDSSIRGGAGLGLAIVREIAERHRARVLLDSAEGSGTRIAVYFPQSQATSPGPRPGTSSRPNTAHSDSSAALT